MALFGGGMTYFSIDAPIAHIRFPGGGDVLGISMSKSGHGLLIVSMKKVAYFKMNGVYHTLVTVFDVEPYLDGSNALNGVEWITPSTFVCKTAMGFLYLFSVYDVKIKLETQFNSSTDTKFLTVTSFQKVVLAGDDAGKLYVISPETGASFVHQVSEFPIKEIVPQKSSGLILSADGTVSKFDLDNRILTNAKVDLNIQTIDTNASRIAGVHIDDLYTIVKGSTVKFSTEEVFTAPDSIVATIPFPDGKSFLVCTESKLYLYPAGVEFDPGLSKIRLVARSKYALALVSDFELYLLPLRRHPSDASLVSFISHSIRFPNQESFSLPLTAEPIDSISSKVDGSFLALTSRKKYFLFCCNKKKFIIPPQQPLDVQKAVFLGRTICVATYDRQEGATTLQFFKVVSSKTLTLFKILPLEGSLVSFEGGLNNLSVVTDKFLYIIDDSFNATKGPNNCNALRIFLNQDSKSGHLLTQDGLYAFNSFQSNLILIARQPSMVLFDPIWCVGLFVKENKLVLFETDAAPVALMEVTMPIVGINVLQHVLQTIKGENVYYLKPQLFYSPTQDALEEVKQLPNYNSRLKRVGMQMLQSGNLDPLLKLYESFPTLYHENILMLLHNSSTETRHYIYHKVGCSSFLFTDYMSTTDVDYSVAYRYLKIILEEEGSIAYPAALSLLSKDISRKLLKLVLGFLAPLRSPCQDSDLAVYTDSFASTVESVFIDHIKKGDILSCVYIDQLSDIDTVRVISRVPEEEVVVQKASLENAVQKKRPPPPRISAFAEKLRGGGWVRIADEVLGIISSCTEP